jgi:type III restriction enzyme
MVKKQKPAAAASTDNALGNVSDYGFIVGQLTVAGTDAGDRRRRVLALQSRHQLFPQVFRYVDEYVRRKVNFQNCHPCELGLGKYV